MIIKRWNDIQCGRRLFRIGKGVVQLKNGIFMGISVAGWFKNGLFLRVGIKNNVDGVENNKNIKNE